MRSIPVSAILKGKSKKIINAWANQLSVKHKKSGSA
jgi:hypothetical protein